MQKKLRSRRPRDVVVSEFAVRVYGDRIEWDGLDVFLWWLAHRRTGAGFLARARTINRQRAGACPNSGPGA